MTLCAHAFVSYMRSWHRKAGARRQEYIETRREGDVSDARPGARRVVALLNAMPPGIKTPRETEELFAPRSVIHEGPCLAVTLITVWITSAYVNIGGGVQGGGDVDSIFATRDAVVEQPAVQAAGHRGLTA